MNKGKGWEGKGEESIPHPHGGRQSSELPAPRRQKDIQTAFPGGMFNKAGCQRSLFSNKSVSGGPGASHKGLLFKATKWEFPNKIKFLKKPHCGMGKGKLAGSNMKYFARRALWEAWKDEIQCRAGSFGMQPGPGHQSTREFPWHPPGGAEREHCLQQSHVPG